MRISDIPHLVDPASFHRFTDYYLGHPNAGEYIESIPQALDRLNRDSESYNIDALTKRLNQSEAYREKALCTCFAMSVWAHFHGINTIWNPMDALDMVALVSRFHMKLFDFVYISQLQANNGISRTIQGNHLEELPHLGMIVQLNQRREIIHAAIVIEEPGGKRFVWEKSLRRSVVKTPAAHWSFLEQETALTLFLDFSVAGYLFSDTMIDPIMSGGSGPQIPTSDT
ncbi:MAG: hypothetical protein KKB81_07595 [Candidatus Margulisbacteria bacterium]|nr:hypothetical protein [Candidatus Margulisiibacteriota bacterium]MBU1021212.1 hypothetical protein [Candidatus Margulisiibacteriota bacterium]MBU1729818.1 hypothetical protein [Candidatus Margulisiibacteriota bacterium]MBU1955319.1 hypothetical protein [Candidatus Margulisiibacteriota bacterium]